MDLRKHVEVCFTPGEYPYYKDEFEIVVVIALICCFGRTHPINLILLGVFTLCESYMVAGLTAQYDKETVILAGLGTALVTVSLTFYAMTTKVEI